MRKLLSALVLISSGAVAHPALAAERTVVFAVENMSCASCPYIVKTSMEKKPELVAVHKEAANIDLKYQKIGSPLPYHPGAKKYFEEQGVKF